MDVETFQQNYAKLPDGLTRLFAHWGAVDDDLREHFAGEVLYLLIARQSLLRRCVSWGQAGVKIALEVGAVDEFVRQRRKDLFEKLGIDVDTVLVPSDISFAQAGPARIPPGFARAA